MAVGDFASIGTPPIVTRTGGTAQKIFLVPLRDFLVMAKPASAGVYKITTAHTFAPGKGFISVYVIQDSGELNFKPIGGRDRRSFLAEGMFEHPGESDEIDKFTNECLNEVWVGLVPLPGSTDLYQIGNEEFQMSIKPSYGTGKNTGDGRTSKFEYDCICVAKIKYTGAITMKTA